MEKDIKKDLKIVSDLMNEIIEDRGVPKNIRNTVETAKNKALEEKGGDVGVSTAIYLLDDISNDINMPAHARTDIWMAISQLEAIKEKLK